MDMETAATIPSEKLEGSVGAQETDRILAKFRELSGVDLIQCGMKVSPQRVLEKMVDGE